MRKLQLTALLLVIFSACVFSQNVGIGVMVPSDKLHVDSGSIRLGNAVWNVQQQYALKFGDANFITVGEDEADDRLLIRARDIIFKPSSGVYPGYVGINTTGAAVSPLEVLSTGIQASSLPGLRLTSAPGLSYVPASWNLYCSPNFGAFSTYFYFAFEGFNKASIDAGTGTYYQLSDSGFKKNISNLGATPVMPAILQLRPVTYYMKDDHLSLRPCIGFLSQEAEKIFPSLVADVQGVKMMNYAGMVPILTQGMQEQQLQLVAMQEQITELKKQNGLLAAFLKNITGSAEAKQDAARSAQQ